jgi:hypothetical protein
MATTHRLGRSVLSRSVISPSGRFGVANFAIRTSGSGRDVEFNFSNAGRSGRARSSDSCRRLPRTGSGGQNQPVASGRFLAIQLPNATGYAVDVAIEGPHTSKGADAYADGVQAGLHRRARVVQGSVHPVAPPVHRSPAVGRAKNPDPQLKRKRIPLQGDLPKPIRSLSGCHFRIRWLIAQKGLCDVQ